MALKVIGAGFSRTGTLSMKSAFEQLGFAPCYHMAEAVFPRPGFSPIPAGEHQARMEFAYAGGGLGKGGKVTLYVDGKPVGSGDVGATLAMVFSADDGLDVGVDSGGSVSEDYGPRGNAFNGVVKGVQISIADAPENSDHLVSPEDAVRIALARQ